MSSPASTVFDPYVLATGASAARRLHALHKICAPAGLRLLRKAGFPAGARVADFGCGVGATTRMLAEMAGPSGHVTGIDVSAAQLDQAAGVCASFRTVSLLAADACQTGLPAASFDVVYCRFLLLHLPDPDACLREMRRVLKPGGIVIVEDGDLASARSVPPTPLNAFGELFPRLGEARRLDYSLSKHLDRRVARAGFRGVQVHYYQPELRGEEERMLLTWSIEEAGPALVAAGIVERDTLDRTLAGMREAVPNPGLRVLGPRMAQVWARKPVA